METKKTKKLVIGVDWENKVLDYKGSAYAMDKARRISRQKNSTDTHTSTIRILDTQEKE